MEGAQFVLHLGGEACPVCVWYNEAEGQVHVAELRGSTILTGPTRSSGGNELWPHAFHVSLIDKLHAGGQHFQAPGYWANFKAILLGRSRAPPPGSLDELKCFTLFLSSKACARKQQPGQTAVVTFFAG